MFSCRLKLAPNWRTLEVRPRVAASPLRSEEAQGVVPLLHRARASETTLRIGNGKPHRVLRHDQRWRRLGQQLQGGPILAFEVVWRVEEDDIGGVGGQRHENRTGDYRGAPLQPERRQILPDRLQRVAIALQKERTACAAAQSLNTYRPRSGIGVQKRRAFDLRRQDVEERLAQAVRRGTRSIARNALQAAGTELSCDDPHHPTATRP